MSSSKSVCISVYMCVCISDVYEEKRIKPVERLKSGPAKQYKLIKYCL
jgi:hypothetical protein